MKQLQIQSVFFLLFILHNSLCQQSSQQYGQQTPQQYSQHSQSNSHYSQQSLTQPQFSQPTVQYSQTPQPAKIQLEDIERDNLKSSQTSTTNTPQVQVQPQQYVSYPQEQLFYIPQQSAGLFQSPQQQIPNYYAAQPPTAGVVSSPQQPQQPLYVQPYYAQSAPAGAAASVAPQSYPYVDFNNFPLYPAAYPYVQSGQIPQISPNVLSDYFKSAAVQPTTAQVKTPLSPVQTSLKTSHPTQVPNLNNYLLSNTLQNAYYQPVSFTQPQNPQYYPFNSFYQVSTPTAAKSIFSSGIKSTTPSAPTKLKEESFIPFSNSNYRFDFAPAEQNHYNKIRTG